MPSISELLAQHAELERQIAHAQNVGRVEAIEKIRAIVAESGLTQDDLAGIFQAKAARASKIGVAKVAAKYRDPVTGDSWSGRGLKPKWLTAKLASGVSLESFLI